MKYPTAQENFLEGDFGDSDRDQHQGIQHETTFHQLFSEIFSCGKLSSTVEFGANRGLNPFALRRLIPDVELSAIVINESAVAHLRMLPGLEVNAQSILKFEPIRSFVPTRASSRLIQKAANIPSNPTVRVGAIKGSQRAVREAGAAAAPCHDTQMTPLSVKNHCLAHGIHVRRTA